VFTKERLGWHGMQIAVPPKKVGGIAVKKNVKKVADYHIGETQ